MIGTLVSSIQVCPLLLNRMIKWQRFLPSSTCLHSKTTSLEFLLLLYRSPSLESHFLYCSIFCLQIIFHHFILYESINCSWFDPEILRRYPSLSLSLLLSSFFLFVSLKRFIRVKKSQWHHQVDSTNRREKIWAKVSSARTRWRRMYQWCEENFSTEGFSIVMIYETGSFP